MLRNGVQRLFDEVEWKRLAARPDAPVDDGMVLNYVRHRLRIHQQNHARFFLAAVTTGTHHPFTVFSADPDVRRLPAEPDRYVPALRHLDRELEGFFEQARREGLLENTIVVLLGDHGRHEPVSRNEAEELAGHFWAPLFIWVDDSLRTRVPFVPREVSQVASQVDLATTILALTGRMPALAPFLGRDLSCTLVRECERDNFAFLSNVYDDLIGTADREGLWLYSLRKDLFYEVDLDIRRVIYHQPAGDVLADPRSRRLLSLYVSTTQLLDQNRIWSWQKFGAGF
jgi:arylsulfatase A-like enzyme